MSNPLFSWLTSGWRARKLAQRILLQVHSLTNPPVAEQKTRRQSTLNILEETSAFLASLQEQKDRVSTSVPPFLPSTSFDNNQPGESANDEQKSQTPLDVPDSEPSIPLLIASVNDQEEVLANSEQKSQAAPNVPISAPSAILPVAKADDRLAETPIRTSESALEVSVSPQPIFRNGGSDQQVISATAHNLMKMSDWVLQAKVGRVPVRPEVLDEIYRQLTRALATEGISLIDASGPYDYERQMIMGTQSTDDPALDDHVHSTVRPGYLFYKQLIRPQEVIVFVSKDD